MMNASDMKWGLAVQRSLDSSCRFAKRGATPRRLAPGAAIGWRWCVGSRGVMVDLLAWLGWVALGSAAGGAARFLVSGIVARAVGETFPWGTMVVNVTGSLAIGVLAVLAQLPGLLARPEAWFLAVTGLLGSYTTVSSFSLQTLALARDAEPWRALGNVVLSLLLCLVAAGLGYALATATLLR